MGNLVVEEVKGTMVGGKGWLNPVGMSTLMARPCCEHKIQVIPHRVHPCGEAFRAAMDTLANPFLS